MKISLIVTINPFFIIIFNFYLLIYFQNYFQCIFREKNINNSIKWRTKICFYKKRENYQKKK